MSTTLSWLPAEHPSPASPADFVEDTYVSERDALRRAIELYAHPQGVLGSGIYVNGTLRYAAELEGMLRTIEGRRNRVAFELLCQTQQIYRDVKQTEPDTDMAARVMRENPMLARNMYRRADKLIAAYERSPL
jgi:hypothetical protein